MKRNTDSIITFIEAVETLNDNKVKISGWGVENNNPEPLEFRLKANSEVPFEVKRIKRSDISQKYELSLERSYGFEISLIRPKDVCEVVLLSIGNDGSVSQRIDVTKDFSLTKTDINSFSSKMQQGFAYLRQFGIMRTFRQIKRKLLAKLTGEYAKWIEVHEDYDCDAVTESIENFSHKPLVSILVPVYNVEKKWLTACIQSVLNQYYGKWELILVDDNSSEPHVKEIMEFYDKEDERIRCLYRKENGHISQATNDGLALAKGEFISLLDNDDTLAPFALYEIVKCINANSRAEIIYSDEDKIDTAGKRTSPFFKPDWSPDTLLSQNYICHLFTVKKSLIDKVGGLRSEYNGAQDYDLALRCTEQTDQIYHIPKILYHWRMIQASTAENPESKLYAFEAGRRALEDTLSRRGLAGKVSDGKAYGTYIINYEVTGSPRVSILIPTKDNASDLKVCIESIRHRSGDVAYEIVVIDNNSEEIETFELFKYYENEMAGKFKVLAMPIPFNYSRLNNEAANIAQGDYLLMLNNDIEILTDNWLAIMLGYAQQKHIGAVGAKLYYPDNTIQHSGVVLGIGGVAGHSHKYYRRNEYGYFSRLIIPANYAAVTGACLLVSKEKFISVDGLNEVDLTVAFNDVDFCIKLIMAGYYNVCLPQVEAYHYESKSRGTEDTTEKQQRFLGEINYMKERWSDILDHDPFYSPNLTRDREDFTI